MVQARRLTSGLIAQRLSWSRRCAPTAAMAGVAFGAGHRHVRKDATDSVPCLDGHVEAHGCCCLCCRKQVHRFCAPNRRATAKAIQAVRDKCNDDDHDAQVFYLSCLFVFLVSACRLQMVVMPALQSLQEMCLESTGIQRKRLARQIATSSSSPPGMRAFRDKNAMTGLFRDQEGSRRIMQNQSTLFNVIDSGQDSGALRPPPPPLERFKVLSWL